MSTLQPQRYEQGRPMLLGGIRRKHTFASMGQDIPRQWDDFMKLGTLPGQVGTHGLRRDLRRRSEDADDGIHVRRRGVELRRAAEGAGAHARPGRALRRVPARGQRRDDPAHVEARSFALVAELGDAALPIRRTSSSTTSGSTARRATAESRFGWESPNE